MSAIPFLKMHGLGNDFVVIDAREQPLMLTADAAHMIADRRRGLGCDQILVIEASEKAAGFMRIYNADGSEASACGNGTRCVGSVLMAEQSSESIMIDTVGGLLQVQRVGRGLVSVDMGRAKTEWEEIPLVSQFDPSKLVVGQGELREATCVNMGNPHAVYFVQNVDKIDLANLGPKIEKNKMFPEGVNVSVVTVESREAIRIRVWERGVGPTLACGSAACAAVVACHLRGLTERRVNVTLPGGTLDIDYGEGGNVLMTGKVATVYVGTFDLELLTMGAT